MKYLIMSFVGDYPLEHQVYWGEEYESLPDTMVNARKQHYIFQPLHPDVYTVIIDDTDNEIDVHFLICKAGEFTDPVVATRMATEFANQ